jgi:hypothetical protein
VWDEDDFRRAAGEYGAAVQNPDPQRGDKRLADYSDEELIAALDESLTDAAFLNYDGTFSIVPPLFRELLRRDFDKGLEWFSGQSAVHQTALAGSLSVAWPQERTDEAIQFVISNKALFRRNVPWSILQKAVASAALRGGDAVASMIGTLNANQVSMNFRTKLVFPPGFDFTGLVGSEEFQKLDAPDFKAGFLNAWRLADRDSAWDWTLDNEGARALSTFFDSDDGMKDNRPWLGGKLDALSVEQRSEFLEWLSPRLLMFPEQAVPLMDGAQDPAVKDEIRNHIGQGIFAGKVRETIRVLDSLADDEARIDFVERLQPSEMTRSRFNFRSMDPASEAFLREKLQGWGADPQRTEAILNRINN